MQCNAEEAMKGKKLIGYGAGMAFLGTQAAYPLPLSFIVDDTPDIQGSRLEGIPVLPSAALRSEKADDIFIIVYANTPKAVSAMSGSLRGMGFIYGVHYIDCSLLHYDSMKKKLRDTLGIRARHDIFARTRELSLSLARDNLSYIAGTWLFIELLDSLPHRLAGSVAECGAYKGQNALISLTLSRSVGARTYHLFDSFEGFPDLSGADPSSRKAEFADTDFAKTKQLLNGFPNVRIHKGFFNETLPCCGDPTYCMVYVDCDLYEPTRYCCEYFYDKVAPGGYMLFHDYWCPAEDLPHRTLFRGVRRAVDEFFAGRGAEILVFPETTHAVVGKRDVGGEPCRA